ncbi:hypothetical protein OGR47_10895 [Methylocystis sp. MJC1]|jgi:hypothetical protein|uniref:hypothetical protein n=1 Tax=Methylocystis sp. MJC1 TaxID=2654282 RepID=UPI0013ED7AA7|nr:hypothetical protein [Methylocystis sp. MJC1]KAF2992352.1 hypothetical protein MJC1_00733 [Methylocystis sp. MJC1]MBU6527489.1 hypothetical protein [Methylocystis sp. MJC1]UZX10435.1 hypothetical protein OGR47_10895 [Methylocystis sp. MJC1]
MTLAPAQVAQIDAALAKASADSQTLASIRQLAPGLMVTRCDALDMRDETPFRTYENCSLYLVDGRDHCWKITLDPGCATGIALAPNGGAA